MEDPISHAIGGRRAKALIAAVIAAPAAAFLVAPGAQGQGGTPLDSQRAQVRALEASLMEVDAQAQDAGAAYSQADARVKQLQGRIARNTKERAVARVRFSKAQGVLAQRLKDLYETGEPSTVELLVSSGSLTDAIDNVEIMRRIERQDQAVLREALREKQRLTRLRAELVSDRADAARTRREMQARVRSLQSLAAQRARLLSSARTTLVSMERAEADRQVRAAAAAQAEAVARAQRQASAVASGEAPPSTGAPSPDSPPAPQTSTPSTGGAPSHLQRIAQCESGGNPQAVSPGGQYRGKYQFDPSTWKAVGGSGDPAAAPEAEQDRRAAILYSRTGPSSWPVCGAQ